MKNNNFQNEQNNILEQLIFNNIYSNLKENMSLELFITPNCNKNCEYCYLQKNKEELYPSNLIDNKVIVDNLITLFNHFVEKNVIIPKIDLFSGEIVGTDLFFEILDIILTYKEQIKIDTVIVPTNGSFLSTSQNIVDKVQFYIDLYKNKNIVLWFSFSVDGLIVDNINRPYNDNDKKDNELFYEKLKNFNLKNHYAYHPMINAKTIDLQVQNLDWWLSFLKDQNYTDFLSIIMFLEVRNDDWTDTKIEDYLKFLKHLIENIKKIYNINSESYINFLTGRQQPIITEEYNAKILQTHSYWPIFPYVGTGSCSLKNQFIIRLGDLAICPCHRLSYKHLLYGKYVINNNKITGIEANNIQFFINNYITGEKGLMKCDTCIIKNYCIKGCYGSQYEVNHDPNYPIKSVCNFMKVKAMFLMLNYINLIEKYNIIDYKDEAIAYAKILNQLKNEDKEFYEIWKNKILTLMLNI